MFIITLWGTWIHFKDKENKPQEGETTFLRSHNQKQQYTLILSLVMHWKLVCILWLDLVKSLKDRTSQVEVKSLEGAIGIPEPWLILHFLPPSTKWIVSSVICFHYEMLLCHRPQSNRPWSITSEIGSDINFSFL